jgi:hypothetical protein
MNVGRSKPDKKTAALQEEKAAESLGGNALEGQSLYSAIRLI